MDLIKTSYAANFKVFIQYLSSFSLRLKNMSRKKKDDLLVLFSNLKYYLNDISDLYIFSDENVRQL